MNSSLYWPCSRRSLPSHNFYFLISFAKAHQELFFTPRVVAAGFPTFLIKTAKKTITSAAICLWEDSALFVRSGPFRHFLGPVNADLVSGGPFPCSFEGTRTRNSLLRYGIRIRCQKQPPGVRDAFSKALGAKNRLMVYGREIRYRKGPSGVPDASSKAQNSFLGGSSSNFVLK